MTKFTIKSSTDEIRAALIEAGHKVAKKADRATVVRIAEQAGMWNVHANSVVPDSYKIRYGAPQNCGDDIAEILKGEDVHAVAKANGIDANARWGAGRTHVKLYGPDKGKRLIHDALNPGMMRMNLGNVLRGRVKRGEYVTVGEYEWNEEAKVA